MAWDKSSIQRYEKMKSEGRRVLGVSTDFDSTVPPKWYDPQKFRRGQALSNKYQESIFTCSISGFLLSIFAPHILGGFYPTEKSSTLSKQFDRYLTTLLYFKEFFTSDPFDPTSQAHQLFKKVKSFHASIGKLLNDEKRYKNVPIEDTQGILLASQWDMGVVYWTQIGLIMLFPEKFGLHPNFVNERDLHDMNYVYRVMGHCLGIEDRFNICSGTLDEARGLYQLIMERDVKGYLTTVPENTIPGQQMGWGIMTSLSYAHPFWSYSAHMKRLFHTVGIKDSEVSVPLNSLHDKISYFYLNLAFDWAMKYKITFALFAWFFQFLVGRAVKNLQKTQTFLEEKYRNVAFKPPGGDYIQFSYQDIVKSKGKLVLDLDEKRKRMKGKKLQLAQCPFSYVKMN